MQIFIYFYLVNDYNTIKKVIWWFDMDPEVFSKVVLNSEEKKKEVTKYTKKRYLYNQIKNIPDKYFVGIYGLRGIGKTVLLLQLANEIQKIDKKASDKSRLDTLYFSADASYLRDYSIYDIVDHAKKNGYKQIFIDEIYYKENWQQDLKTIYDEGEVRVFFSGSTSLQINKGVDLSRRTLLFNLKPLSFREYIIFNKLEQGANDEIGAISIGQLFDEKERKKLITDYAKYAAFLNEYYYYGGIFNSEVGKNGNEYFYMALENTLDKIIHHDLAYLRSIDIKVENDIQRVLDSIALKPVGESNYSNIASKLSISKPTLIRIMDDLQKIGLVKLILPVGKLSVRKEPKFYLAFPFRAFLNSRRSQKPDIGSLREEFFVNHVDEAFYIKSERGEKTPDFLYNDKKIEIGGEGKNFKQNPDYIVKDGVILEDKVIPLFLFGFLY